jgi:hypothetical protein
MTYPEKIPNSKIQNFTFSFQQALSAQKDLENEHENLDKRISNIVDSEKFYINGFPVLKNILMLSPKRNELKKLARAIDRLADLVEVFDTVEEKLSVIKTLHKDPNWFAWTFGDHSIDFDQEISSIINSQD